MRRPNLSQRKTRRKEFPLLTPSSVCKSRLTAPTDDHKLRNFDRTAMLLDPPATADNGTVNVIDDLTMDIPITNLELDVIETYLGSLLNAILEED